MMYKFKIFENGNVTFESNEMTKKQAHDFYVITEHTGHALRLFKNGESIPYAKTQKELNVTKAESLKLAESTHNELYTKRKSTEQGK